MKIFIKLSILIDYWHSNVFCQALEMPKLIILDIETWKIEFENS